MRFLPVFLVLLLAACASAPLTFVDDGYRFDGDPCRLVGESADTSEFLDDSADLVACPVGFAELDEFIFDTDATEVGRVDGYILYSVPVFLEEPIIITETGEEHHLVSLFFATNRGLTNKTEPPAAQFNRKNDRLRYGIANVSIPLNHEIGHLEGTGVVENLLVEPDPEKHVILRSMDVMDTSDVMAELTRQLAEDGKSTLLYIHGFNTNVETAARRSGQLTYDLNWRGPSFFFVWPSQENPLRYRRDKRMAEASQDDLQQVLERIASTDTDRIIVIAHSMGTDLLANTLSQMETRDSDALDKVTTVVLAAPDINAANFQTDIVPAFDRIDDENEKFNVTVYASDEDSALSISSVLNGVARVGSLNVLAKEEREQFRPVEIIDASGAITNFFGHTYINDNATVIEDVYCILYDDEDPSMRTSLLAISEDEGSGFRIRPKVVNATLDKDGPGGRFTCD